jgi:hypothetical protein
LKWPTLKGTTVMKVPPGTQPDKVLRLKGLGIPSLKHHTTGDQVFTIKVHIPTKLTAKQRELLMEFAKGKRHVEGSRRRRLFRQDEDLFRITPQPAGSGSVSHADLLCGFRGYRSADGSYHRAPAPTSPCKSSPATR